MADFTEDFVVDDEDDVASADIHIHNGSSRAGIDGGRNKMGRAEVPSDNVEILDAHKLAQRQKQVDFGKNTIGYQKYLQLVPRHRRTQRDPATPDVKKSMSKRGFDGVVKAWRRLLHVYDTVDMGAKTSKASNTPVPGPAEAEQATGAQAVCAGDDGHMLAARKQQGSGSVTPGAAWQRRESGGRTPGSTHGMNGKDAGSTPQGRDSLKPGSPMRVTRSSCTPRTREDGRQGMLAGESRQGRRSGEGQMHASRRQQRMAGGSDRRAQGSLSRQHDRCERQSGAQDEYGMGSGRRYDGRRGCSGRQAGHDEPNSMLVQGQDAENAGSGDDMPSPDSKGSLDAYLGPNYKPNSRKRQHDVVAGTCQNVEAGAQLEVPDADAPQPKRSVTSRSMEISLLGMPNQASTAASGPVQAPGPTSFAGLGLAARLHQEQGAPSQGMPPKPTMPASVPAVAVDGMQPMDAEQGGTAVDAEAARRAKAADEDNILKMILGDSRTAWADDEDSNTARMCM